MTIQTD